MTAPKDGGPAFPRPAIFEGGEYVAQSGMSLRDWFAGQALQGLMHRSWDHLPTGTAFLVWTESAYAIADAILAARQKGHE